MILHVDKVNEFFIIRFKERPSEFLLPIIIDLFTCIDTDCADHRQHQM